MQLAILLIVFFWLCVTVAAFYCKGWYIVDKVNLTGGSRIYKRGGLTQGTNFLGRGV